MRYYLDTEFIEDGHTIDLISLGLVAEDGRTLYLCNKKCEFSKADDWVWANVLSPIGVEKGPGNGAMVPVDPGLWVNRDYIKNAVLDFCDPEQHGKPEFMAYYADYDWVVFCQLFGRMIHLPEGYPMYCRDLKQIADDIGGGVPEHLSGNPPAGEHNALTDALWVKDMHEYILSL